MATIPLENEDIRSKKFMKRNFVCILPSFSVGEYPKDAFLVSYYIGKLHNMSVSLVFHRRKDTDQLQDGYKGIHLIPLSSAENYEGTLRGSWAFVWYLLNNARKIDVLMRFHFSYQTILLAFIYKICNPKGLFYLKADGYGLWYSLFRKTSCFPGLKQRDDKKWIVRLKNSCIRFVLNIGVALTDKVSVEISEVYNYLKQQSPFIKRPDKLIWMLNGIDEEAFSSYGMVELPIQKKENWIISVGRHGNWQKNTGMLLKALASVELKGWKVFFIGAIEPEFKKEIEAFYQQYESLKDSVQFIGPIYDQKLLWEYYNKSKVFVHTAVYESYGIVLGEAFRFNNYILSTDVGIASEFIKRGYGRLIPDNDFETLAKQLQLVVDEHIDLESLYQSCQIDNRSVSWEKEVLKLGVF